LTATAKIGVDGTGSGTTSVFSSDAIINSADEVQNTNTTVIDITSSGSDGAAGNVQPSFVVNYIIKT
jgi:microcystin-dependent protein